jgi:predicted ArsR family transcriptional regulator
LTQAQRRELIAEQLKDTPEKSNRQIAAGLGVDDKTVGVVREGLESTAEIPQLEKTIGADGKSRPRTVFTRSDKEAERAFGLFDNMDTETLTADTVLSVKDVHTDTIADG